MKSFDQYMESKSLEPLIREAAELSVALGIDPVEYLTLMLEAAPGVTPQPQSPAPVASPQPQTTDSAMSIRKMEMAVWLIRQAMDDPNVTGIVSGANGKRVNPKQIMEQMVKILTEFSRQTEQELNRQQSMRRNPPGPMPGRIVPPEDGKGYDVIPTKIKVKGVSPGGRKYGQADDGHWYAQMPDGKWKFFRN